MSPHVANFVHDLVAMAKAMEENPVLQDQIEALKAQLGQAQDHNAGLEVNIISYKQQIDDLQAKVRSLEVERDDASFRVLEAEDKAATLLYQAQTVRDTAQRMINLIQPPKPEPVVEQVQTPTGEVLQPSHPFTPIIGGESGGSQTEPNREGLEYDKATDAWYPKAVETVQATPPDATQGPSEASPIGERLVGSQESPPPVISSEASTPPTAPIAESVDTPSVHSEPTPADADPEPTPKYSYEWYQWNDRRNEREQVIAALERKTSYGY